jgi:hypothetical protein
LRGIRLEGEIKTKFRVLVSPPSNNFLATSATLFTGEEVVKCDPISGLLAGEQADIDLVGAPFKFEVAVANFGGVCLEDLPDDPGTGTY